MMIEAPTRNWYALYVTTGFEKHARDALQERIARQNVGHKFGEILLPMEKRVEIKKGVKKETEERMFPGYLFIEMTMDPECWHLVKGTRRVNGFIGGSPDNPQPLSEEEITSIRARIEMGAEAQAMKARFAVGEQIRIKEGPFSDFTGVVETVHEERERLTVSVMVFGRSTPVELDFDHVDKT